MDELDKRLPDDRTTQLLRDCLPRVNILEEEVRRKIANVEIPRKITEELAHCKRWIENCERQRRRNNVIIKGVEITLENLVAEANEFLCSRFGISNKVEQVRMLDRKNRLMMAKLKSAEAKTQIMRNKKDRLAGTTIFINHDCTSTERYVEARLRAAAKGARNEGRQVKMAFQKIIVDDICYIWDLEADKLIQSFHQRSKSVETSSEMLFEETPSQKNALGGPR